VVEWAEKVEDLLPTESIRVTFEITNDNSRRIAISWPEQDRFVTFQEQVARFSARR
jgi:tRNA A37 threonylcarbamoyladenosine biosynthesis protein TsaE